MTSQRQQRRDVETTLEKLWSDYSIAERGKHLVVTLRDSVSGISRKVFASKTPSDGRGLLNFRGDVRREVEFLKSARKEGQK